MQDVILLVSTSAIFIFGYFMVKKLDAFLENNWNEQEHALIHGENSLKIGFSNPLMAGGLADAFETYGKQHPDVSIHIFSGEESELCRELETHKLDIIFLSENTDISKKTHYNAFFSICLYSLVKKLCPICAFPVLCTIHFLLR